MREIMLAEASVAGHRCERRGGRLDAHPQRNVQQNNGGFPYSAFIEPFKSEMNAAASARCVSAASTLDLCSVVSWCVFSGGAVLCRVTWQLSM